MNSPQFEIPQTPTPAPRPSVSGWAALFIVLGLLIGLQLVAYFNRDSSSSDPYLSVSAGLRTAILQNEAIRRIPQVAALLKNTESLDPIDNLVSQVVDDRKTHATAARLYAAMRQEQKKQIKPEDLELLTKSQKPEERAFAQIYLSKSLTSDEVDELTVDFPEQAFSYRMGKLHALEKAGDKTARKKFFPDSDIQKFGLGILIGGGSLFGGVLLLFVYLAMRLSGRWKPMGHPAGQLTAEEADVYAGRAALMLIGYIVVSIGVSIVLSSFVRDEVVSVVAGVLMTIFVILLISKFRGASGPSMRMFAFEKKQFWGDVAWGICGAIANVPLFLCCALVGTGLFSGLPSPEHPISTQLQSDQGLVTVILLGIAASIIAPIFEEICFRGTITPAMERLFGGPLPGIIAAGLAFAAIHPTGIPAWLPLAMIGSMAAMLTYQRKSLVPAIVFHAVHNGALLLMMLLLF